MGLREQIRCPMCDKLFFEAFWVSSRLSIVLVCRCKRLIEVREDYSTHIMGDAQVSHPRDHQQA